MEMDNNQIQGNQDKEDLQNEFLELSDVQREAELEHLTLMEYVVKYNLSSAGSGYIKTVEKQPDTMYDYAAALKNYDGYDPTKYKIDSNRDIGDKVKLQGDMDEYGRVSKLDINEENDSGIQYNLNSGTGSEVGVNNNLKSDVQKELEQSSDQNQVSLTDESYKSSHGYWEPRMASQIQVDGESVSSSEKGGQNESGYNGINNQKSSASSNINIGDNAWRPENKNSNMENQNHMEKTLSLKAGIQVVINEAKGILRNPSSLLEAVSGINMDAVGINLNSAAPFINVSNMTKLLLKAEGFWIIADIITRFLTIALERGGVDIISEFVSFIITVIVAGTVAAILDKYSNVWRTGTYKAFAAIFIVLAIFNILTTGIAVISTLLFTLFEGIGFLISRIVALCVNVIGWFIVANAISQAAIPSEDYD